MSGKQLGRRSMQSQQATPTGERWDFGLAVGPSMLCGSTLLVLWQYFQIS